MVFPYDSDPDTDSELEQLRDEVDLLRMQLTACSIAAQCNTQHAAAKNRVPRRSPYWSAAYQDVCHAVDREMAIREKYERILKDLTGG